MALVSVVVPVYDVEAYLPACLDSLLGQSFVDIEVIAVDDCSPDGSGAILDAYAERDPRVRVVHLSENVGLGAARNVGLSRASGTYVWFVDSDDWLAHDALGPIAERLVSVHPDLLLVGHAVARPDGSTWRDPANASLFGGLPRAFTAADRPAVFRVFPSSWNRLFRREFLLALHMEFPDGAYEDIPVTFPALCAAERISSLDRVCLYYRQRDESILGARGSHHFDVLSQYELAFERLATLGSRTTAVYEYAVRHLFLMLGSGRLVGRQRRDFFRQASALLRRFRPPGFRPSGGRNAVRHALFMRGSWRGVALVRGAIRGVGTLRRAVRTSARAVATVGGLGHRVLLRLYYWTQLLRPLDEDLALYCAYWGRGRTGNPRAIDEKARELVPSVRAVWAVEERAVATLPPDVDPVVQNTAKFFRALARATYLVNNANFGGYFVKRRGSVFLQTHHGTPLKVMGVDERPDPSVRGARGASHRRMLARCRTWDYQLSSSAYSSAVWKRAYPVDVETLEYGYPRNDVLVSASADDVAAQRARFGIGADETVVLYTPTHRGHGTDVRSLLDPASFVAALGPGHRILVRAHYYSDTRVAELTDVGELPVVDVSGHPVVEELYLVADVLVTDYSSAMFDYALLDRPIVIYAPDWDAYRDARGVYFDLEAEPPGLFTRDPEELVEAFRCGGVETAATRARRNAFRARFCKFDDGRAATRAVRRLMLGQDPDLPAGAR